MITRTPREQADEFIVANDKSPVISGSALEPDPHKPAKGAVYTLADKSKHRLGLEACSLLPDEYPKWKMT